MESTLLDLPQAVKHRECALEVLCRGVLRSWVHGISKHMLYIRWNVNEKKKWKENRCKRFYSEMWGNAVWKEGTFESLSKVLPMYDDLIETV